MQSIQRDGKMKGRSDAWLENKLNRQKADIIFILFFSNVKYWTSVSILWPGKLGGYEPIEDSILYQSRFRSQVFLFILQVILDLRPIPQVIMDPQKLLMIYFQS